MISCSQFAVRDCTIQMQTPGCRWNKTIQCIGCVVWVSCVVCMVYWCVVCKRANECFLISSQQIEGALVRYLCYVLHMSVAVFACAYILWSLSNDRWLVDLFDPGSIKCFPCTWIVSSWLHAMCETCTNVHQRSAWRLTQANKGGFLQSGISLYVVRYSAVCGVYFSVLWMCWFCACVYEIGRIVFPV